MRSSLDIEVLAYNRTQDGLLTTLHDLVPYTSVRRPGMHDEVEGHYVATFNPGSNPNQVSRLRVINSGVETASVLIEGIDDNGDSPGTAVQITVPARASRTLTSRELESGQWDLGQGADGMLGDGKGKWRLVVTAEQPIEVMSLLASPTGHLVNLSTAAPRGETVPGPAAAAAIEIIGRSTASAGTPLALSVSSVGANEITIDRFDWEFSDGQMENGSEISVEFATAGLYTVVVRAMSGPEVIAETTAAIAVFDEAAGANPGFEGVPMIFGDVGQDGTFGPEDLALAEQGVAGIRELEPEAIEAGDLDLSGALDERDIELMAQALLLHEELPSTILDDFAYPAGVVAMVSPALMDPDEDITVYVDGVQSPQVMRAILGYATFVIPASLTAQDTEVAVDVKADGVVADSMTILLKRAPGKPAVSAKDDIRAFLEELSQVLASQESAGATFIEQTGGLSPGDTAVLLGLATAAANELRAATDELEELLNDEDGEELAELIRTLLYANGLAEFRESLRAPTPDGGLSDRAFGPSGRSRLPAIDVCDVVDWICLLKIASSKVIAVSGLVAKVCTIPFGEVANTNSVGLPIIGQGILKRFGIFCGVLMPVMTRTYIAVPIIVSHVVNAIELGMRLTSDKTALASTKESATITAEITFAGLQNLCGPGAAEVLFTVLKIRKIKNATRSLLKSARSLEFVKRILDKVKIDETLMKIGTIVGAFSPQILEGAVKNLTTSFCDRLSAVSLGIMANARKLRLYASAPPSLTFNTDGTASLVCPAGFSGFLEVTGNKYMCDRNKSDVVRVSCGAACAGEVVNIPDAGLRAAVEEALYKAVGERITPAEMGRLKYLFAEDQRIGSLTGLECAAGLKMLDLGDNQISDVSPLSGLSALKYLFLQDNQISDVSPLSGLTALEYLDLENNQLSDVSPLSGLTALEGLDLSSNRISDVSPLSGLTALKELYLEINQISDVSPLSGLTALEYLDLENNQLSDVSPLSGLTALKELYLENNQILDVSPLSGLSALKVLFLLDNQISDVSPLSGLSALEDLYLENNQISNVSPLSGLTSLKYLDLSNNEISDIGPLVSNAGLGDGDYLFLSANPLNDISLCTHIPALEERGVYVSHDLNDEVCGDTFLLAAPLGVVAVCEDSEDIDCVLGGVSSGHIQGLTGDFGPVSLLRGQPGRLGISLNQFANAKFVFSYFGELPPGRYRVTIGTLTVPGSDFFVVIMMRNSSKMISVISDERFSDVARVRGYFDPDTGENVDGWTWVGTREVNTHNEISEFVIEVNE